jgi:Arc/MetJ-type ribon-helix-helix transcriptional regulator
MTVQIAVRIRKEIADTLDQAVARGEFATRTEAIRVGLDALARRLREQEIAEEYRRAYGSKPQEEWVGEFGLSLLRSAIASETPADEAHPG